jgi:hypothetical protein
MRAATKTEVRTAGLFLFVIHLPPQQFAIVYSKALKLEIIRNRRGWGINGVK